MRKRNGFTLTEVVLAVILVGMVGVAVASLSSLVSRNSSTTTHRLMLRSSLSTALRQIREDVQNRFVVNDTPFYVTSQVRGDCSQRPPLKELLRLKSAGDNSYVIYYLQAGNTMAQPFEPSSVVRPCVDIGGAQTMCYCYDTNALAGGQIVRRNLKRRNITYSDVCEQCNFATQECEGKPFNSCFEVNDTVLLGNVKFIPKFTGTALTYPVPLFRKAGGNALKVNLIVEIPDTTPTISEAAEEVFFTL